MKVHVKVPATSANLGVGLDCLGVALNIWNELIVEESSREEVFISGEGEEELPRDTRNLVVKSFRFFLFQVEGLDPELVPKFRFLCTNNIPLERGLGSSTAAIVAGLVAAATLVPHLQRCNRRAILGSTLSTQQQYNCSAISTSAGATADSVVVKPSVYSMQRRTDTFSVLGKEATCSCLQGSSKKRLAPDKVIGQTMTLGDYVNQRSGRFLRATHSNSQRYTPAESPFPCCGTNTTVVKDVDWPPTLLQVASDMEGHADNAGPALYGGLRLTLACHYTRDEHASLDVRRTNLEEALTSTKKKSVEESTLTCCIKNTDTNKLDSTDRSTSTEQPKPADLSAVKFTGTMARQKGLENGSNIGSRAHVGKWIAKEIQVPKNLKLVLFVPKDRLLTETARGALPRTVRLEDAVHNVARAALFIHCLTASAAAASATATAGGICCPASSAISALPSGECCVADHVKIRKCGYVSPTAADESFAFEDASSKAAEAVLVPLLQEAMNDKLHQPYRRALNPHLEPLIASANKAGALGTALSGAGPSVVALCMAQRAEAVASAMKAAAEQIKKTGRVLVTEASDRGAHIVDLVVAAGHQSIWKR